MHLCMEMGEASESADCDWMCGQCQTNPVFLTLENLFLHKKEVHLVKKRKKVLVLDALINSESQHADDFIQNDSSSDEDIPLSHLVNTKPQLKPNLKMTIARRREQRKNETTKTDRNLQYAQLVEEAVTVDIDEQNEPEWTDCVRMDPKGEKKEVLACKICKEAFSDRRDLSRHKESHRCPETGLYKCPDCGKSIPKYDNCVRHMETHRVDRPKDYQCDSCWSSFYSAADLKRHQTLHLDVKPYTCEECCEGFVRHDVYLAHVAKHSGLPFTKYLCQVCHKNFNSASSLGMHKQLHREKSIFCSETGCTFSCYMKSQLRQHMKTHMGERPFQCPQCGKCFTRSNDMKTHILSVHEKYRAYKCSRCPRTFKLLSSMTSHEMSHLGLRPFLCEECGKSFSQQTTLKKHIAGVHQGVNKKSSYVKTQKKFVDAAVQSDFHGELTGMQSLATSGTVPVTIQFPLTVSLDPSFAQTFGIPITSPSLIIKSERT